MTLTELSIKRPSLIIIIFAALGVLGIFSFIQLQYELLPKFSPPVVTIITMYPGASPNEVETGVTKVIEDVVSGLDKVSNIKATSQEGVSFVMIQFDYSANIDFSLQDTQRKVNEILSTLPSDCKSPTVSKIAIDELPVLRMGLTSSMPPKEFYQFIKDKVKPQISKIAGVGQVVLLGGNEREIKVNIDTKKLESYGLSILQVTQAIKTANLDFPTGKIKDSDGQYIVRIAGKFTSIDELRNLVIAESKLGGDIKLGDVAEIEDGIKEYTNISRINGVTSVGMNVQKQTDANSVEVSRLVRKELSELEKQYSKQNLKFNIAMDGSEFTLEAANAVKEDLLIAVVLVAIVMLLFLHSIRNSVIVMIAIPASLISTFLAMYALGFTLNMMTLLALSLVVGILVDDSIVVLENIYHHLEMGEEKRGAALKGRNEIGFAALAITMVDVATFLPLGLVSGIIGNIMRQFAIVIVCSTLLSLFVSFTITPMLASRFAKLERLREGTLLGKFALGFEKIFNSIGRIYDKALRWGLANRGKVALIALSLFVASLALAPLGFIGAEFMTQADRGEFSVTMELNPGSTFENTNYMSQRVERILSEMPEIKKVFVNVGASSEGLIGFSSNRVSELNVTLVPRNERKKSTDDVASEIKQKIQQIPGIKVRVNPIGIFGTANQTPIQIVVSGTNVDEVNDAAKKLQNMLAKIPGTADVRLSSEDGKPETKIQLDREKMASFGITLADVGSTLRIAFAGDDDSKFRDGPNEYDIRINVDQLDRSKTEEIGNLTVASRKGQLVQLKQFANISRATGPTVLQREERNSAVTVYSQVIGRAAGSITDDLQKEMKKAKFPESVDISFSGDTKNMRESFGSLMLALFAAILFTYMIMVALYDSFVYPFIVLFSIPVAMVGAFLALALTMKSLNIFSILGILMLVGLVAKNAILLVDRTNQKRAEGESVFEALLDAGKTRLRPIVMTTLTMVFGMLPIALSTASGAEWKSGLAWALIGGLTSSLVLTLVLVPVVYSKVEEFRVSVPAFFRRVLRIKKEETSGNILPKVDFQED
jgi:HAE1 family hydrophobic/amphiphilic exporter-1